MRHTLAEEVYVHPVNLDTQKQSRRRVSSGQKAFFVVPESDYRAYQRTYQVMLDSVRFR